MQKILLVQLKELFQENNFKDFLEDKKYLGIHIHRKHWESHPVTPKSFWEWALRKYGQNINE